MMNNNPNCDHIRADIEAYVLGVLDKPTTDMIREHLASCPACQQLVTEYESIVDELPFALLESSSLQPPAHAKQQLMATIDHQQNNHQPTQAPTPTRPQIQFSLSYLRRFAFPVFNILFVMSLALSVYLGVALARERSLRESLEHQTELIFEIVDSDRTERAFLAAIDRGSGETLPPYGKVFKRNDMPYIVAMTGRLPQPPAGQTYSLWLFNNEQAERAGEIVVDAMGFGALVYDTERVNPDYERAQVILQPQTSVTPVGTPILSWQAS